MPTVKVTTPSGLTMELESVEDAAKFYGLITETAVGPGKRKRQRREQAESNGKQPSKSLTALFSALSESGLKIVKALVDGPQTTDEISVKSGVAKGQFPSAIRGIRKEAKRVGFMNAVDREAFNEGGKPKSRYTLSDELVKLFKEEG